MRKLLRRLKVTRFLAYIGNSLVAYIKTFTTRLTMAQRLKVTRIIAYFLVFDAGFLVVGGIYMLHFAWTNNPTWLIRVAETGSVVAFVGALIAYLISAQLFARAPVGFWKT